MADGGAGLHPAAASHHFVHALIEVPMRSFFPLVLTVIAVTPAAAQAADMQVTVNIPRLNVAEYHKPSVAIWVEGASLAKPTTPAVWLRQEARSVGKECGSTCRSRWATNRNIKTH